MTTNNQQPANNTVTTALWIVTAVTWVLIITTWVILYLNNHNPYTPNPNQCNQFTPPPCWTTQRPTP